MKTLTIPKLPEQTWEALQRAAQNNSRSIEEEAAARLTQSTGSIAGAPKDDLLERIRDIRERMAAAGCTLTPEEIDAAINEGRP